MDANDPEYPRVLAIAWGMFDAPTRGPKRELSFEAILDAAIALADADGLAGVTMAKVAQSLGFTTMSLYRYVASKEELLILMLDRAFSLESDAFGTVDSTDWRRGLRQLAKVLYGGYCRRPWLLDIPISSLSLAMPHNVQFSDLALTVMRTLDIDPAEQTAVLLAISQTARGFAALERDFSGPDGKPVDPGLSVGTISLLAEVITPERFPQLAQALTAGTFFPTEAATEDEDGEDFLFSLDRLLDGIAAYAASRPCGQPAEPAAQSPAATVALAERDLASTTAQRKAAQATVKEWERKEAAARKQRDQAKERSKQR